VKTNKSTIKVCILTTVHPPFDTRIFHKQAKSLAEAGYDVTLIAQHDIDEVSEGVKIVALPKPKNRLQRMFGLTLRALRLALKQRAVIYHFHDPELIPIGVLLRLFGKRVIYDVHEDYWTSIMQKRYLPRWIRPAIAQIITVVEMIGSRFFTIILAERYYAERFPSGVTILNYPRHGEKGDLGCDLPYCFDAPRVLYTGNVTEDRGALIHARLVHLVPDLHVYLIGRCSLPLAESIREVATPKGNFIHLKGVGSYVPHTQIRAYYTVGGWLAGLALFPPSKHYQRKELTKLFEYMAAGLPIICSDFPVWKEIVERNECGLTVNPLDPQEIAGAIKYLLDRPELCEEMGKNGRRAVEEKYNWEREKVKLLELYSHLLN